MTAASVYFLGGLVLVEVLLADGGRVVGPDLLGANVIRLGQLELRFLEVDIGLGAVELGLVGPFVDLEQEGVFLDLGAFGEGHLHQIAGDARPDIDGVNGVEASGELLDVHDLALDGPADHDHKRGVIRLRRPRATAGQQAGAHQ